MHLVLIQQKEFGPNALWRAPQVFYEGYFDCEQDAEEYANQVGKVLTGSRFIPYIMPLCHDATDY